MASAIAAASDENRNHTRGRKSVLGERRCVILLNGWGERRARRRSSLALYLSRDRSRDLLGITFVRARVYVQAQFDAAAAQRGKRGR